MAEILLESVSYDRTGTKKRAIKKLNTNDVTTTTLDTRMKKHLSINIASEDGVVGVRSVDSAPNVTYTGLTAGKDVTIEVIGS